MLTYIRIVPSEYPSPTYVRHAEPYRVLPGQRTPEQSGHSRTCQAYRLGRGLACHKSVGEFMAYVCYGHQVDEGQLEPAEAAARTRPQRFWYGPDLGKLTLVRRRAEQAVRVGDRVVLKNEVGPSSTHGKEGEGPGIISVDTLVVKETRTRVSVLWQDGTREIVDSKDTVPYLNPDEYDCWLVPYHDVYAPMLLISHAHRPGDHVIWKSEGQRRPAVVQSVNAIERTAYIRFLDSGNIELASVLELDPHGTSDSPVEGLGLHRGEFVFIHKEGTTNEAVKPMVPRIGELEAWVRESPVMHVNENGQLGGWRREMAEIGNDVAQRRGRDNSVEEGKLRRRPPPGDTSLNWFGEVVDVSFIF